MWFREKFTEDELKYIDEEKIRIKNEVRRLTEFTIEPYHLSLLSRMHIDFGDEYEYCYEGIFCTDDKRPFGNKTWMMDIATEMCHDLPDDDSYMDWYKENYLKYYRVFQEMQLVMNLVMKCARYGGVEVGKKYTRKNEYTTIWDLI